MLMTTTVLFCFIIIIVISFSSSNCHALRFDMIPNQQVCFFHEAIADSSSVTIDFSTFNMITGSAADAIVSGKRDFPSSSSSAYKSYNVGTLEMIVFDPDYNVVVKNRDLSQFIGKGESHTGFTTSKAGEWEICFTWRAALSYSQARERNMFNKNKKQANNDEDNKDNLPQLEVDILSTVNMDFRDPSLTQEDYGVLTMLLMPQFEQAEYEMDYLITRSGQFEQTVNSTYTRIVWLTILEVVLIGGIVVWQVLSLRKFFKDKKVV